MELGRVPDLPVGNANASLSEYFFCRGGAVLHLVEAAGEGHEQEREHQQNPILLAFTALESVDTRVISLDQVVPKDPWIPPDERFVGPEACFSVLAVEDHLAV